MRGTRPAPAGLDHRELRAAGATVATLLAQPHSWERGRDESVEPRGTGEAHRRVTVELELPRVAWAPAGAPAIVPLALVPKEAAANVAVRDEWGAEVAVVPEDERLRIAAAGLLAVVEAAGADDDALTDVVWRIVAGTPEEAAAALAELERGDPGGAWAHVPFRRLARQLAGHSPLLVALPDGSPPGRVTYEYDVRATGSVNAWIRPAPLVAATAALLLGAEAVAASRLADDPGMFALLLAATMLAAAWVSRRPADPVTAALLHRPRGLLIAVAVLCFAGQLPITLDASASAIRLVAAPLACLAALAAGLLVLSGAAGRASGPRSTRSDPSPAPHP